MKPSTPPIPCLPTIGSLFLPYAWLHRSLAAQSYLKQVCGGRTAVFLGLCGAAQEPAASLTPIFPLGYLGEVLKVLETGMLGAQGETRMVLDVSRGLVEMKAQGKAVELKYGELMLLAKFKTKKVETKKVEIRGNGIPVRTGIERIAALKPLLPTQSTESTPAPVVQQTNEVKLPISEITSLPKPDQTHQKNGPIPPQPKPVLKPLQPDVRQAPSDAKITTRSPVLKPEIKSLQAPPEIRPTQFSNPKPDLKASMSEPKPSPQPEPVPTLKTATSEAAQLAKQKKPSASEMLAALRNQVRDQRRVQLPPAPKEAENPSPASNSQSLSPAVKDRLLKLDRLQDLCEEFFEARGLPLGEMSSRQGKLKVCRIEVEGRSVAEATGETWEMARGRAAWEAVCQFDKVLAEEWLAVHQGALTARFFPVASLLAINVGV